jgi:mRNA interferase HigB
LTDPDFAFAYYLNLRYTLPVHIITRKALIEFWEKHPESQTALLRWFKIVQKTEFNNFADLRKVFPSADKLDPWIIFNIGGNKYRLITSIHFKRDKVYIRHVLTHAEYDRGDWKNDTRK